MNAKERVRIALEHREPDRVPAMMSASQFVVERLKAHLRVTHDRDLLDALHIDVYDMRGIDYKSGIGARYIGPPELGIPQDWRGDFFRLFHYHEQVVENTFGPSHAMGEPPLGPLDSLDALADFPWPQPDWFDYSTLRAQLEPWSDFAIAATGCSVFQHPTLFRGIERLLLEMGTAAETAEYIMDKVTDFYYGYFERAFAEVGDQIDIFRIADDIGAQNNLFISPKMLDRFLAPRVKKCAALAHRHGIKVLFHTDGNVRPAIPRLIDWGVDVLDPVQPEVPSLDAATLKREYGGRLAFSGGVSAQEVLPFGDTGAVRAEVRRVIDALAPGGGYILSPGHPCFQVDVPVANIVAMYEEGFTYGRY
jgi:uroporphyrinogen decarboxylase